MKKLSELFTLDTQEDVLIKGIKTNSNEVEPGDLFLCIMGVKVDRHDYIEEAIKRGAVALCVSKEVNFNIPTVQVENTNAIVEELYSRFYDHPQKEIKIIGLTGTDGKTSTATIVQHLLGNERCGYIGTNGYSCHAFNRSTNNTTPAKDKLLQYFREFLDAGCSYVALETSSEAFYHKRLTNLSFEVGAISNITSEHLNTHKTLENYINCKKELFLQVKEDGYSILNMDDAHFEDIKEVSHNILTYGRNKEADLFIKEEKILPNKTHLTLVYKGQEYRFTSPLLGAFNTENLCEALLVCLALNEQMEDLIKRIPTVNVSGRMDVIDEGQNYYVLVDYAHTPNGIKRLLEFTKTLDINRSIVVIGQAGERDPFKRKEVGQIVADYADLAIFTYEDPRNEDVDSIIDMMCENLDGYNNYKRINDRKEAIEYAIHIAEENDMVMILGKGSETYQKIKNDSVYFSDIEEAKNAVLKKLG